MTLIELIGAQIIVAGDSAGGNMSLSLISHLLHPHEAVTSKFTLSQPLAGAVLISPWVKLVADDGSVIRNAKSDMITPSALVRWSKVFLGTKVKSSRHCLPQLTAFLRLKAARQLQPSTSSRQGVVPRH